MDGVPAAAGVRVMEVLWSKLKAREIRDRQTAGAVVVVPVGSTEQHGPHLPVQVDALIAGAIAESSTLAVALRKFKQLEVKHNHNSSQETP